MLNDKDCLPPLRVITAGSVDDGKSTLIGRLLYDSKALLSDQLSAVSQSKFARTRGQELDLSLFTDGLEAEREQGITIDVAYRYFATAKRKFILADAPGHEQYTRNLVTGASQSDAAILLIDATRLDTRAQKIELLDQTKRHLAIVQLLGLQHCVIAVNKLDLLGFNAQTFAQIAEAALLLSQHFALKDIEIIPISALQGDNVVEPSKETAWYTGPTLLEWLENIDLVDTAKLMPLRLPVQYVMRQDGQAADDFRGYLGRVESGSVKQRQSIKIFPSAQVAHIQKIYLANYIDTSSSDTHHGDNLVETAYAGQNVCICLDKDISISRGDLFVASEDTVKLTREIRADICWLDQDALQISRKYIVRHQTKQLFAKVKCINHVLDIQTLSQAQHSEQTVGMNAIANIDLALQQAIACDTFDQAKTSGSFLLIDANSYHTVAAGMIRHTAIPSTYLHSHTSDG